MGKYTLVRKIATGGMAEVFLARAEGPLGFQKRVVVKRILPHHLEDPRFVQMFLGEATLAAELNHPNLVTIFDFGESDGQYYIAMEYIDGPNLRVLERTAREHQGPMPFPVAARIMSLAAEGLHSAHELRDHTGTLVNLVHRDISPDNILVSRTGAVKVVDFGIAKSSTQLHHTRSNIIKGKLAYMPPEQLAREALDRRADIFALGVVLYELVSGVMPFDSTSEVGIIQAIMGPEPLLPARARCADVPPSLDAIISRCLEKKREARFPSCKDLQAALDQYVQSTGRVVSTNELAALVNHFFPPDWEPTLRRATVDEDDLGPTLSRRTDDVQAGAEAIPSRDRVNQPITPRGPSGTLHQPGPPSLLVGAGGAKSSKRRWPWVLLGVTAAVAATAFGAWRLRDNSPWSSPSTPDAAVIIAPLNREPGSNSAEDAAVAVAEPKQGLDAGVAEAADASVPSPPSPRMGRVEFRIRPWAVVSVDGKLLGPTPFSAPVSLSVGRHRVRLENAALNKSVTMELVVKPGDNVFKFNLKE